jgi:hypothetical protein
MTLTDPSQEPQSFPPAKVNQADRKQLKQIFISLILIGLAIGGLLSVGIVAAMNHFGLTQRPAEQQQSQLR